jgi:CBS domain containing-hemolysin-like protein
MTLSPTATVWLAVLAGVMGVILTTTLMVLADLTPGALRRLESSNPELATPLAKWFARRNELQVTLRILLILDVVLLCVCGASWLQQCQDQGLPWSEAIVPIAVAVAIYFLLTEWLGCDFTRPATRIALKTFLPLVRFLGLIVAPLALPVAYGQRLIRQRREDGVKDEEKATAEDEIMSLVEKDELLEDQEAELEEDERRMIKGIFDLDETLVREIMTPRVDIDAVEDTETVSEVKAKIVESGHTRIPVFHETIDHIVGLVHAKDLLDESRLTGDSVVTEALHSVIFIPESKNIGDLLAEFQQNVTHFAVVVDEYGGTDGIVTLEDILEEIVGEIHDEYDQNELAEAGMQVLPDGSVMVDARTSIYDLNEEIGIDLPEDEDFDTLGGYATSVLGHIPARGEVIKTGTFSLEIIEADKRRILKAKLVKRSSPEAKPESLEKGNNHS